MTGIVLLTILSVILLLIIFATHHYYRRLLENIRQLCEALLKNDFSARMRISDQSQHITARLLNDVVRGFESRFAQIQQEKEKLAGLLSNMSDNEDNSLMFFSPY